MRTLYSQQLFLAHAVVSRSFVIPAGERWVVRTITTFYPGGSAFPAMQIVETTSNATVWWDSAQESVSGLFRYWTDLRLTLEEGQALTVTGNGGPDISISGYQFIL